MEAEKRHDENDQLSAAKEAERVALKNLAETGDVDRISPTERLEMSREEFDNLIGELTDDIKEGKWSSLVVDDVSGRIPALVIRKIMHRWAEQHSRPTPKIFFVASGRGGVVESDDEPNDSTENLLNYLENISDELGDRVLIVTEGTNTGHSLEALASLVRETGHSLDVAALYEDSSVHKGREEGNPLYEGDTKWYGGGSKQWASMPLYANAKFHQALRDAIGVEKYGESAVVDRTDANQPAVNEMRAAIDALSNDLFDKYMGKSETTT